MPLRLMDVHAALISQSIAPNETAANATLVYVVKWMEGVSFDLEKSAVKTHRARLRKLGIDIAQPYDPSFNFSAKVGGSAD